MNKHKVTAKRVEAHERERRRKHCYQIERLGNAICLKQGMDFIMWKSIATIADITNAGDRFWVSFYGSEEAPFELYSLEDYKAAILALAFGETEEQARAESGVLKDAIRKIAGLEK